MQKQIQNEKQMQNDSQEDLQNVLKKVLKETIWWVRKREEDIQFFLDVLAIIAEALTTLLLMTTSPVDKN